MGRHSPHEPTDASTTDGLPVAPSLGPTLDQLQLPPQADGNRHRIVTLSGLAILTAIAAALAAEVLLGLIALVTNLAFYQRLSLSPASPADHHLGPLVVIVPVIGGFIVGLMARFGTPAIRGHQIPEAMERVLRTRAASRRG